MLTPAEEQGLAGLALAGRVHLLRGDLEPAADCLDRAQELIAAEHWTAFEPFVAGLRGETFLVPAARHSDERDVVVLADRVDVCTQQRRLPRELLGLGEDGDGTHVVEDRH